MTAPPFVGRLLGRRKNGIPNTADKDSSQSVEIANALMVQLGIDRTTTLAGQKAGSFLEHEVAKFIRHELKRLAPRNSFNVAVGGHLFDFAQYGHLADLTDMVTADRTGVLSTSIGRDYEIKPDVTVSISNDPLALPFLQAAVSCKFTIRSDRVQNIRHEASTMIRHRRGRLPHIVAVTSEPLPSRLASIARGTGEIDAVYHVALDELIVAVHRVGGPEQSATLDELVGHGRLRPLSRLPKTLLC